MLLLYHHVIRPILAVRTGVSLLDEQDFSCRLANVGQRDADNIAATFNRMIDTLRAERCRVLEQNHFLELLIDASPAGIIILNLDGSVRSANAAAREILDNRLKDAIDALPLHHTRTVRLGDTRIYRCSRLSFIDNGFQRQFIMIESLTQEIMVAERAAYGKVIRQIAHEVNNTMCGILPMFETVGMVSADPTMAEVAASCSERCNSLSRFITRYADVVKLPPPTLSRVDLSCLLESLMPFVESMASGRNISLRFVTEGELWADADPLQIEQVVVNVVKNAIESVEHDGEIEVCVTPTGFTISDNGPGISPEAADNLFTPFYSTKDGGQGIGLTLISEILKAHKFRFSLTTSASDGLTRFAVITDQSSSSSSS